MQGARFGRHSIVSRLLINWPNQLSIGDHCIVQEDVSIEYCHGKWRPGPSILICNRVFIGRHCEFNARSGITIGDDCLIASGCKFIDHDHGMSWQLPMNRQDGREGQIVLEADVWLGVNVVVLRGVRIGRGAVVGAGSVVTKSIPGYEVWAGVPARKIGVRPQPADQTAVAR
jgi:acetyltransferase-like isoleucine patch superfamily enzyme